MNQARDNFYQECPAVMNYASFTDYRANHRREQYIRTINNIKTDYEYKDFLQGKANKIMTSEWGYLKNNFTCQPNLCVFNSETSPPPGSFNLELKTYNDSRMANNDNSNLVCKKLEDYRLSLN
jgi:hypothetical protein